MNNVFIGLIKWLFYKGVIFLFILTAMVGHHYAMLYWEGNGDLLMHITQSKADRAKLIATVENGGLKKLLEAKAVKDDAELRLTTARDRIQVIEKELDDLWPWQIKMMTSGEAKLLTAMSENVLATAAVKASRDVYGKLLKRSLDARKNLALPQELKKLENEEAKLKLSMEYYEAADAYYRKCVSLGIHEDEGMQKREESIEKYDHQKRVVLNLREHLGDEEYERISRQLNAMHTRIRQLNGELEKDKGHSIKQVGQSKLVQAFVVLLGIVLIPVFIKVFLYYVVAPQVDRMEPVKIGSSETETQIETAETSVVSVSLDIPDHQEALIHSHYLQSCSSNSKRSTQLFLNYKIPLTSLASGMSLLTKLRAQQGERCNIKVSPQRNVWEEVSVIHIPEGASMVIQARGLVGIVHNKGESVQVTSHWRLFHLHAWLTLQLRYLVFHGECQVIVKGCRGVRTEDPSDSGPRMINQTATMGFSTCLSYQCTRCETFTSYFLGREDLFNDRFTGEDGIFLYEEVPSQALKGGIGGRGLEGVIDAGLKLFGI